MTDFCSQDQTQPATQAYDEEEENTEEISLVWGRLLPESAAFETICEP